MPKSVYFRAEELLPAAWRGLACQGPLRSFNPALLADGPGWLFAYRMVGADSRRRIAVGRLDAELRIIPGSAVALSDLIRFAAERPYPDAVRRWFADPRLYRLDGRLFVYWNSGWNPQPNFQFIAELDSDTLMPRGAARELRLAGARRPIEKNWTFFGDDPVYALYSPMQQAILDVSLDSTPAVELRPRHARPWDIGCFAWRYGELRGGAPPQRVGESYYAFCHTVYPTPLGYNYTAVVYRFSAAFPFRPTDAPLRALRLENPLGPDTLGDRLNPHAGTVIYPCGAAHRDGTWLISYGINDARAAIALLSAAEVEAAMQPLTATA